MVGTLALFGPLVVALWVFSLADVLATPPARVRRLSKRHWLALTAVVPFAGSVAWIVAGRPSVPSPRPPVRPGSGRVFADYDIRELTDAMSAQDRREIRRRCRERAQEQRRRHADRLRAARGTNGANGANGANPPAGTTQ